MCKVFTLDGTIKIIDFGLGKVCDYLSVCHGAECDDGLCDGPLFFSACGQLISSLTYRSSGGSIE